MVKQFRRIEEFGRVGAVLLGDFDDAIFRIRHIFSLGSVCIGVYHLTIFIKFVKWD